MLTLSRVSEMFQILGICVMIGRANIFAPPQLPSLPTHVLLYDLFALSFVPPQPADPVDLFFTNHDEPIPADESVSTTTHV